MAQYRPPELAVMARGTQAAGPAMTALRAVGASTASIIRCLGIAYTLGQLAIWHSFFAANPWRLAGPVIAMAWGATVVVYLSRRRPGWAPAAVDSAVYIGLALGAGWCVPPAMRGDGSNWLYIVMLGQLVAPAWFAPIVVSAPLALASVASYYVGAVMAPHVSSGDGAPLAATVLLLAVAAAAWSGRRLLVRRATGADIALEQVDAESRAHYVDLTRHTERREHERMLHDTVLNTLTALARADPADAGAGAAGPVAGAAAVGAAVVPVVAGVVLGERPGLLAVAGVLVALPAIVLVAASGSVRGRLGAGLFDGLAAGLAFGILFIGLAQAGRNAGLWPGASEQAGTLLVTLAIAVKSRQPLRVPVRAAGLPALAGASGMAATVAYFYATHFSMLAVAAVLVSLYPGFTVLLARVLLHERFSPAQRAGLGLCALAIAAIAVN